MKKNKEQFIGYLKYFGPSVAEGRIDIEKIGNSLIALNQLFKTYAKSAESKAISLKLGKIKKNCTEVNVYFEQIIPIIQPVATMTNVLIVAKIADYIGITEFGKQFFGTLGQQIALKLFAKGKKVVKQKDFVENGKIHVLLRNSEGEEKKFLKETFDSQNEFSEPLKELIQLESKKEEKLEVGYYDNSLAEKVADIDIKQKDFFVTEKEQNFEEKLEEDFDESKAEQVRINDSAKDALNLINEII